MKLKYAWSERRSEQRVAAKGDRGPAPVIAPAVPPALKTEKNTRLSVVANSLLSDIFGSEDETDASLRSVDDVDNELVNSDAQETVEIPVQPDEEDDLPPPRDASPSPPASPGRLNGSNSNLGSLRNGAVVGIPSHLRSGAPPPKPPKVRSREKLFCFICF